MRHHASPTTQNACKQWYIFVRLNAMTLIIEPYTTDAFQSFLTIVLMAQNWKPIGGGGDI